MSHPRRLEPPRGGIPSAIAASVRATERYPCLPVAPIWPGLEPDGPAGRLSSASAHLAERRRPLTAGCFTQSASSSGGAAAVPVEAAAGAGAVVAGAAVAVGEVEAWVTHIAGVGRGAGLSGAVPGRTVSAPGAGGLARDRHRPLSGCHAREGARAGPAGGAFPADPARPRPFPRQRGGAGRRGTRIRSRRWSTGSIPPGGANISP